MGHDLRILEMENLDLWGYGSKVVVHDDGRQWDDGKFKWRLGWSLV